MSTRSSHRNRAANAQSQGLAEKRDSRGRRSSERISNGSQSSINPTGATRSSRSKNLKSIATATKGAKNSIESTKRSGNNTKKKPESAEAGSLSKHNTRKRNGIKKDEKVSCLIARSLGCAGWTTVRCLLATCIGVDSVYQLLYSVILV
jgi:hypothetical protein